MGRASLTQHSMNGGELSPQLLGRQDLTKYQSGLYVCLNALPLSQGGWTRRGGSQFLTQARHHDKLSRLFAFRYSIVQNYVLEFGEAYIRFFAGGGILTGTAQNLTAATKAGTCTVTYDGADTFANGDRVFIVDAGGMTQLNNREFEVADVNAGANTFNLKNSDGTYVNSTAYGTYTSGGTIAEIIQVTTPYQEADLVDLRVVQSADTLYILHPDYAPRQLVRNSATSWTLSTFPFSDGPYGSTNTTATTMTLGATSGTTTLTASAVTGINNDAGWANTDIGRLVRLRHSSTWSWGTIIGVGSTTVATIAMTGTAAATTATTAWRLGIWSDTTGWPRAGTFFEDRLVLGGAANTPQRWDASKSGDYVSYSPTANDGTVANDYAIAFALNSSDVNTIKWIRDNEKGMVVGTAGGEWIVRASEQGEALTPTNVTAKAATRHGSADVDAILAGKAVLFVQRAARKVREMAYVFEKDGFVSPDMTLLAEHITETGIVEMTYQEQPQPIVWAPRTDGVLLGFTYERDQEVTAWHRHELGGYSDASSLFIPVVESVAVIPSLLGTYDELYMVVQRYVNGAERRYIEVLAKQWETSDDQEDAVCLDCSWTQVFGTAASTLSGLWHLEGEEVLVYADGKYHPARTVTNGAITLAYTASVVTLGYGYNSDGQLLPSEGGAPEGNSQGMIKRINRVGFWLLDTLGLKFGPDADNLTELLVRQWGDLYGTATPLATGIFRERYEGDYDRLGQVYWRCDGPFPATVLAINRVVTVSNDS